MPAHWMYDIEIIVLSIFKKNCAFLLMCSEDVIEVCDMHIRYVTERMQQQLRIATSYHSTDNRGLREPIGRIDSFLLVLRSARPPDEEHNGSRVAVATRFVSVHECRSHRVDNTDMHVWKFVPRYT